MEIPERITTQLNSEVICTMACMNNVYQNRTFPDFPFFVEVAKSVFLNADHIKDRKDEIKLQMIEHMFGVRGVSADILPIMFKAFGKKSVLRRDFRSIKDGWLVIRINNPGYLHAIAIVRGYIIDSIKNVANRGGVYKWNGIVLGYSNYDVVTGREFIK